MTGLVIGGQALLVLAHHHRAPLGAHHDLVLGLLELVHAYDPAIGAGREQRRLVDQVGQIGPGEARRAPGDDRRPDIIANGHLAHMNLQDLLPATDIG